jgi:prepilin-type N-terminal cleavage/methylation domain-containing protein
MMKFYSKFIRGFTLVEMAVVLVILGLALSGLTIPLSAQFDLQNIRETRASLQQIKDALQGYALSHTATDGSGRPYLPCPDTSGDGVEEPRVAGVCPSQEGRVPWSTLGTPRTDAWNNRFRYRVHPNFSNSTTGFSLTTTGTLRVCTDTACAPTLATGLVAVIVSHGKNGYGARNDSNTVNLVPAATSADELDNINGRNNPTAGNSNLDAADTADVDFVSQTPTPTFDDIVVWIPTYILFSSAVSANKLP